MAGKCMFSSFNSSEPCPGTCANVHSSNFDHVESINDDQDTIDDNFEVHSPCKFKIDSDNCYTCR